MPYDGFAQGYNASREYWGNRRSEAARAFSEFRNLHPDASYSDYKSFVDQVTGGNSYLRGSIPSDQILQSLAQQGQQKAEQARQLQQLELLRAQAQTAGTIGALANTYALQYDNDADVEDALVSSLGGESARERVRKMYSGGYGAIRQRGQFAAIKDNLPLAMQMLEANPELDLASVFPDMPKSALGGLSDAAKKKYQEAQTEKRRTALNTLVTEGKLAIDMGGAPTYAGYDPSVVELAQPRLDAYRQKLTSEKQAADKVKRNDALKKMVDDLKTDTGFLSSMTQPGFAPLSILIDRARQYGITDLSAGEAAPYIQDLQEDSVAAKKAILTKQREAQIAAADEKVSTFQKSAVSSLSALLGTDEKGKPEPLAKRAGPYAAAAKLAVESIGMEYDLTTPAARSVLSKLVSADALKAAGVDPSDYAQVQRAITENREFRAVASPLTATKAIRDANVQNSTGLPRDLMTFGSWLSDFGANVTEQIREIDEKTIKPILESGDDLGSAGRIEQTVNQLNQLKMTIATNATRAAKSADMWLIPGSGGFDANAADQAAAARIYEIQALIDKLNSHKTSLEKKVQGARAAEGAASTAATDHAARIQSWSGRPADYVEPAAPRAPVAPPSPIWPGDEEAPAPIPSPWDDYWKR